MRKSKFLIFVLFLIGLSFLLVGIQYSHSSSQDEIDRIRMEIKLQGLEWEAGETSLSKLSPEERKMRLGGFVPSYEDPDKYVKIKERAKLPLTLDWRAKNGKNYITLVKSQGSCGSCWAFAPIGTIEAIYNIEHGVYSSKHIPVGMDSDQSGRGLSFRENQIHLSSRVHILSLQYPDLSEQDLVSCSGAGNCDGGADWDALDYIKNNGVVSEECFPYEADDVACARCSDWLKRLSRIKGWGWVTQASVEKETIKNALQDGPLSFFMEVYSDFYSYKKGIYKPTAGATYKGGHCVVLIGYNENNDCWICKNSWGNDWGESGYFKIKMGECETGTWVLKAWGVTINNKPPVLSDIGDQSVKEGQEISIQFEAYDADDDLLTFSASPLPSGASFNNNTGLFNWTPNYTQSGEYNIRFKVTDGMFEDFVDVKITVINVKKGKGKF